MVDITMFALVGEVKPGCLITSISAPSPVASTRGTEPSVIVVGMVTFGLAQKKGWFQEWPVRRGGSEGLDE